jgi:hypothetical protein
MKLLIMQSPPDTRHTCRIRRLGSKYSLQHPVLKTPLIYVV